MRKSAPARDFSSRARLRWRRTLNKKRTRDVSSLKRSGFVGDGRQWMLFVLLPAQQQKPMFTECLKVRAFRYFLDPCTPRDTDIWQRDETLSAESSPPRLSPRLSERLCLRHANTPTLTPPVPQHRLTSLVALRDQHDHQEEAHVASEKSRRRHLLVFRHTTPAQQ